MPASRPAAPGTGRRSIPSILRSLAPPFGAGLLFSVLMLGAFPPFGWWGLVFLAPMPLVWAGAMVAHRRRAESSLPGSGRVRIGLVSTAVAAGVLPLWAYEMSWVFNVSAAGYWPMILALASFLGMFVWLVGTARHRLPILPFSLTVPVVWAGVEFLRGDFIFHGLPWLLLAHPTIDAPIFPATASLLGTYFTSFLVALPAGAVADLCLSTPRRPRPAIAAVVVLAGCVVLANVVRPADPSGDELHITVVQTNIPQDNKMEWEIERRLADFSRFADLTRRAAGASPPPDLIVWPETMFPGEVLDPESVEAQRAANLARIAALPDGREVRVPLTYFADELVALQGEIGIPLLVGAMATTNLRFQEQPEGGYDALYDARYNSAFLVQGGRIHADRYDKIDLTPFGEEMPYISLWPWLERQLLAIGARGMAFDLKEGGGLTRFEIGLGEGRSATIVTPICFEATRAGVCRRLVMRSRVTGPADAMVNLTNDGWFGSFDPARWQHLQIARWRCIELNVPMVRAANTGVSAHIDARGRVVRAGVDGPEGAGRGARVDGLLATRVSVGEGVGRTIFARVGGVFGWIALGGAAALAAGSLWVSFRSRRAGTAAAGIGISQKETASG